ncbi:MAG: hypothetical protein ABEH66_05295 [Halobacteriales archaeon]
MPPLVHTDGDPATTATVTIRIPHGGDGDLVGDAERRLSQAPGIEATVESLTDIEPGLSATVVTVEATIRQDGPMADAPLCERLADVPGLESIDGIG